MNDLTMIAVNAVMVGIGIACIMMIAAILIDELVPLNEDEINDESDPAFPYWDGEER